MPPLGKDLLIVGAGHARRSWARDTGLQRIGRTNPSGWARAGWPGLTAARGAVAGILPFGLDQAVAGKAVPKAAAMVVPKPDGPGFCWRCGPAGCPGHHGAEGRQAASHPSSRVQCEDDTSQDCGTALQWLGWNLVVAV